MEIKVFGGPGCAKCITVYDLIFSMVEELKVKATVIKVSSLSDILGEGLMATPAVSINGQLKCSGRIPTASEVKSWLTDQPGLTK